MINRRGDVGLTSIGVGSAVVTAADRLDKHVAELDY